MMMDTMTTVKNSHHTPAQCRTARYSCAECADCKATGVLVCSHEGERSDYSETECDYWCPSRVGEECECRIDWSAGTGSDQQSDRSGSEQVTLPPWRVLDGAILS